MLDLHRLVLLREVWLHGGVTAAARALSYSHSAVSQQLSQLEREAGARLLEKVGRGTRLTPAGLDLVRNTESILAAVEKAESDLAASHERAQGIVTIAAFASLSRSVLPSVIDDLRREHPELDIRVRVLPPEEATPLLASRRVDAVLTDAYPGMRGAEADGIHAAVLGRDPMRGYLPPGAAASIESLSSTPWVMEPGVSEATHWALRVCRELGFEPLVAYESSDLLFHVRMVESGLAAAFLPDLIVREAGATITPSPRLPIDQQRSILFLSRTGAEQHPALVAIRETFRRRLALDS